MPMDVEQTLVSIVEEYCNETPVRKTRFIQDLGFDSLDTVELMLDIEENLNIDMFLDFNFEDLETFEDLVLYIESIVRKK